MICVCLADGFEEIEAIATIDILRRAGLEVQTVGVTGESVTGTHGMVLRADVTAAQWREKGPLQAVVLPGGMPGMTNLLGSAFVDELLQKADRAGALLCAICASPSVLGLKGYLAGKKATCYPGFEKNLTGAAVVPDAVVTDGGRITGKGAGVTLEFALAIVAALLSEDKAKNIRREMQCQ